MLDKAVDKIKESGASSIVIMACLVIAGFFLMQLNYQFEDIKKIVVRHESEIQSLQVNIEGLNNYIELLIDSFQRLADKLDKIIDQIREFALQIGQLQGEQEIKSD